MKNMNSQKVIEQVKFHLSMSPERKNEVDHIKKALKTFAVLLGAQINEAEAVKEIQTFFKCATV